MTPATAMSSMPSVTAPPSTTGTVNAAIVEPLGTLDSVRAVKPHTSSESTNIIEPRIIISGAPVKFARPANVLDSAESSNCVSSAVEYSLSNSRSAKLGVKIADEKMSGAIVRKLGTTFVK